MNTVVYYPHFAPPVSWLKVAALCWENVYRLLPDDAPPDPPSVAALDSQLGGVLKTLHWLEVADRQVVKDQFKEWILAREDDLARRTRVSPTSAEDNALLTVGLYRSKFPVGELVEFLVSQGLATVRKNTRQVAIPAWEEASWAWRHAEAAFQTVQPNPGTDHYEYKELMDIAAECMLAGDWQGSERATAKADAIRQRNLVMVNDDVDVVELPQDVALHYVSLCANEAAASGKRDLVGATDALADSIFHKYRLTGEVAIAVLQAVLPANVDDMEPERIRDLRSELAHERLLYQRDIEALASEFAGIASEGELHQLRSRLVDLAQQRMAGTRRSYARARLDLATQALGVSLTPPAAATWLASTLSIGLFTPVAVAGAVGLLGTKLLLGRSEARHQQLNAPWSYLLRLESAV